MNNKALSNQLQCCIENKTFVPWVGPIRIEHNQVNIITVYNMIYKGNQITLHPTSIGIIHTEAERGEMLSLNPQ